MDDDRKELEAFLDEKRAQLIELLKRDRFQNCLTIIEEIIERLSGYIDLHPYDNKAHRFLDNIVKVVERLTDEQQSEEKEPWEQDADWWKNEP